MRKIALTCWIIAGIMVLIGWQFRDRIMWQVGIEGSSLLREITTDGLMQEAFLDKHAIIFLEFDWNGTNAVYRKDLDKFARDWYYSRQAPYVTFYLLDMTDDSSQLISPMSYVGKWIASDSTIWQSTRRGDGGVVFMNAGVVAEYVSESDYFAKAALKLPELARDNFRN